MRIDLPGCSFKDCRKNFDGNCMKKDGQDKCEFYNLQHEKNLGKWIFKTPFDCYSYECSNCGSGSNEQYPFCHWCGKEMYIGDSK